MNCPWLCATRIATGCHYNVRYVCAVYMLARASKSIAWRGQHFYPCKSGEFRFSFDSINRIWLAWFFLYLLWFSIWNFNFYSIRSIHQPNSHEVTLLAALLLCYAMSIAHNSLTHFSVAIDFESSINNRFHRYLINDSNKMAFTCTLRCVWWISFGWLRLNDLTNDVYRTYTHTHWFCTKSKCIQIKIRIRFYASGSMMGIQYTRVLFPTLPLATTSTGQCLLAIKIAVYTNILSSMNWRRHLNSQTELMNNHSTLHIFVCVAVHILFIYHPPLQTSTHPLALFLNRFDSFFALSGGKLRIVQCNL